MRLGVNGRFLAARPTGVQRFAREIFRRLCRRAEVTLFLPAGIEPDDRVPGFVRSVKGRLPGPVWEQLELPVAARRAGVEALLHPANAAPIIGGPHVVVLHDVLPLIRPADFKPPYRAWVRVAHFEAARRAAAVATVSAWSADHIAERLAVPRERIVVVRQGAGPLDRPASHDQVDAVRREYGIGGTYFVTVAGGDSRKGAAFLEEVWTAGERPPSDLVIVGGAYRAVHRGASVGTAQASVRRIGHVPDEHLRALYTGSVALLHPSAAEGFGRPPLEALACGTRVVVSPYGPAREVVGNAADIVLLDVGAWRTALREVLSEDADARLARIALGARHAAAFSWDEAAEAVLDMCRSCVGSVS